MISRQRYKLGLLTVQTSSGVHKILKLKL